MKLNKLETYEGDAISCVYTDNEMLLKNVEVDMGDVIELKDKQYLVLSRSGRVLDVASAPGFYKVVNGRTQNKEVEENWNFYKNRIQEKHCYYAFFINLSEIVKNESSLPAVGQHQLPTDKMTHKDDKMNTKKDADQIPESRNLHFSN